MQSNSYNNIQVAANHPLNYTSTFFAVPTAPPANLTVTGVTSRTATLTWDPPPYEGQNGVIRKYVLTVNRSDTSFFAELTTTSTQLIVGSLFPFRTYLFTVAAETIELGPFSTEVSTVLLEDGKLGIASYVIFVAYTHH